MRQPLSFLLLVVSLLFVLSWSTDGFSRAASVNYRHCSTQLTSHKEFQDKASLIAPGNTEAIDDIASSLKRRANSGRVRPFSMLLSGSASTRPSATARLFSLALTTQSKGTVALHASKENLYAATVDETIQPSHLSSSNGVLYVDAALFPRSEVEEKFVTHEATKQEMINAIADYLSQCPNGVIVVDNIQYSSPLLLETFVSMLHDTFPLIEDENGKQVSSKAATFILVSETEQDDPVTTLDDPSLGLQLAPLHGRIELQLDLETVSARDLATTKAHVLEAAAAFNHGPVEAHEQTASQERAPRQKPVFKKPVTPQVKPEEASTPAAAEPVKKVSQPQASAPDSVSKPKAAAEPQETNSSSDDDDDASSSSLPSILYTLALCASVGICIKQHSTSTAKDSALKKADATITNNNAELKSLRADLATMEIRLKTADAAIAAKNVDLKDAAAALSAKDVELKTARDSLAAKTKEFDSAVAALTTKKSELQTAVAKQTQLESQLSHLTVLKDSAEETVVRLTKEKNGLSQRVTSQDGSSQELQRQLNELEAKLSKKETEFVRIQLEAQRNIDAKANEHAKSTAIQAQQHAEAAKALKAVIHEKDAIIDSLRKEIAALNDNETRELAKAAQSKKDLPSHKDEEPSSPGPSSLNPVVVEFFGANGEVLPQDGGSQPSD